MFYFHSEVKVVTIKSLTREIERLSHVAMLAKFLDDNSN